MLRSLSPVLLVAFLMACGGNEGDSTAVVEPEPPTAQGEQGSGTSATTTSASDTDSRRDQDLIIFLGDSLTAGLGLDEGQAFPALVQEQLKSQDQGLRVVNAGVSGDTTAGGLARLDWLLQQEPTVLVLALGANDGLRGLAIDAIESNLRSIIERAKAAGARVLLCGMLMPPNYGPDYTQQFANLYPRLAEEQEVEFLPFLLEGVAGDVAFNQADGIHPNAAGQRRLADNVMQSLQPLLSELRHDNQGG